MHLSIVVGIKSLILSSFLLLILPKSSSSSIVIGSESKLVKVKNSNSNFSNLDIGYSPHVRNWRKSKFYPLFTIMQFTNAVCKTNDAHGGVCYMRNACTLLGGTAQGSCGVGGFGVCCKFEASCGEVIIQNGTMIRNPNYPSKYSPTSGSEVCQIRIRKLNNVCQLRFNFLKFEIDGPSQLPSGTLATTFNDAGTCKTDTLTITSSGAIVPQLCGILSNQHLYVDFGTSDVISVNLMFSGNGAREREWDIEVLMIPCNSMSRAPTGCLQYFTEMSGQVESFNFGGGTHLANQDYSICIRTEDGMRAIEWSGCTTGSVKISGPTPLPTQANAAITCPTTNFNDYLIIMGGIQYPIPTTGSSAALNGISISDRFCDASFGLTSNYVRSTARPFILHFRTDGRELPGSMDARVGFCLKWQMQPF